MSKSMDSPNSRPPEQIRFFMNVVALCKLVKKYVKKCNNSGIKRPNYKWLGAVIAFITTYHEQDNHITIQNFIRYSVEHWDSIQERDEIFLSENAGKIFGKIIPIKGGEKYINMFAVLITAKDQNGKVIISDSERTLIWEYFFALVKISIIYLHNLKKPYQEKVGKKTYCRYEINHRNSPKKIRDIVKIKVTPLAAKWEMKAKLSWPKKKSPPRNT